MMIIVFSYAWLSAAYKPPSPCRSRGRKVAAIAAHYLSPRSCLAPFCPQGGYITYASGLRRIAPLPHPRGRAAGAATSSIARSRRPSASAAPMQPPRGLPKYYLCVRFAADSPPAPPMRSSRRGSDIEHSSKPPPQRLDRPDAAPQGASQIFFIRFRQQDASFRLGGVSLAWRQRAAT